MDDVKWLIAREAPHLRRFAISLLSDVDRADNLVQDTLERALRKRRLWRRSGSIRSWLFKVLYRVYLNEHQRERVRRDAVAALDTSSGNVALARQERHVELLNVVAALRELPADQRAAVLLVGLEGLPYDEAAAVLGVPIGTLKSRLYRGREALWAMRQGGRSAAKMRRVE